MSCVELPCTNHLQWSSGLCYRACLPFALLKHSGQSTQYMHRMNQTPKLSAYFLRPKNSIFQVIWLLLMKVTLRSLTGCEKPTQAPLAGLLSQPPAHFPGGHTVPWGTQRLQPPGTSGLLHWHSQASPGAYSHIKTEQEWSKSVLISAWNQICSPWWRVIPC